MSALRNARSSSPLRRSPLDSWFREFAADEVVCADAVLRIEDLSGRCRFGCKGPGAPAWLSAAGFSVPAAPNSASVDSGGVFVARLATSEFLIEAVDARSERIESAQQQLGSAVRPPDVYPVARQDLVLGIRGEMTNTLLRQICSVDFAPALDMHESDAHSIMLTSMMGVGVVAWPRRCEGAPGITLWVDPSFGFYFCKTLLEIARSLGVVAIGISRGED